MKKQDEKAWFVIWPLIGIVLWVVAILLLTGCGSEIEIPDISIERIEPEIMIVDGQVFVRYGEFCLAVDESAPYPPGHWLPIDEFDGYRLGYGDMERYYCAGGVPGTVLR